MYKKNIGRGDKGFTDICGKRIPKSSNIIFLNALIDDINALISMVIVKNTKFSFLNLIQKLNSKLMSYNAGYLSEKYIDDLIDEIKKMIDINSDFKIKEFVYFQKDEISALLNMIRTRIRIAEIYAWKGKKRKTAVYLNKLSDLFFVYAFKHEKNLNITFPQEH